MTPLLFRPVQTRLYVAYIVDAYNQNSFKKCDPANTFARAFQMLEDEGSPYMDMWMSIQGTYAAAGMAQMTDEEITQLYATIRGSKSYELLGTTIRPMQLMQAKQRWDEFGWTRYERKRNGRRKAAKMLALPCAALLGISLPQA